MEEKKNETAQSGQESAAQKPDDGVKKPAGAAARPASRPAASSGTGAARPSYGTRRPGQGGPNRPGAFRRTGPGGPRKPGPGGRGRFGGPGGRRPFVRRKVCRFCANKWIVDYKETEMLRTFISDRGKILSRRITGTCAMHQRMLTQAVKRARMLAMLPFTTAKN